MIRQCILMVLRFVGIGLTPPPIIKILTSTYNPQMLYNHAMLYKGWHNLKPEPESALDFIAEGGYVMPRGFAELIARVRVQRKLKAP